MKKSTAILILSATALVGTATAQDSAADLDSLKKRASYAIGMDIATNMKTQGVDLEGAILAKAITDVFAGNDPLLKPEEARAALQEFSQNMQAKQAEMMEAQASKNVEAGKAFLEANKAKEGVKTTDTGLQYKVTKEGAGDKPGATSRVTVHYTVKLLDGTVFDSSVERGEPAKFGLNQVIPGWTEGLQLMTVGSKYEFWIPSALAYDERGAPPRIGPHSTLNFEVELISID